MTQLQQMTCRLWNNDQDRQGYHLFGWQLKRRATWSQRDASERTCAGCQGDHQSFQHRIEHLGTHGEERIYSDCLDANRLICLHRSVRNAAQRDSPESKSARMDQSDRSGAGILFPPIGKRGMP